ncbi:NAD-dependent protein deacetylase [soil metagenome]
MTNFALYPEAISNAVRVLQLAKRVAVLTGAGVSAESGVPTFRASDGLWEGHRIEDVATPEGFRRDPALVWQFYNARRDNLTRVTPNPGHYALAALQDHFAEFTLATQNVDGLHAAAGSKNVLELHGNVRRTRCLGCRVVEDQGLDPLGDRPLCLKCGGFLRPDIVWFHESLPEPTLRKAFEAANDCDVLLVIGTSAVVYPAAEMIPRAKSNDATVIEINLTPAGASEWTDIGLYEPSGVVLPKLCEGLGIQQKP